MSDDTPHPTLPNDEDAGASRPAPGGTVKLSTAGLEAGLFDDRPPAAPAHSHGATMGGRQVVTSLARPVKARDLMEEVGAAPAAWRAKIVTLFPEAFPGVLGLSLTGKALEQGKWALDTVALRDFGVGKHRNVDDTPAGGGAGMVLRADVVGPALEAALAGMPGRETCPVVYMSPRGARFDQAMARRFAAGQGLVILCGRFEGVDQRVLEHYGIEEVSAGDFVLTGGELAAQIVLDATVRLRPEVLGNSESTEEESFSNGLLEYPQYTRPAEWQGRGIPEVLTSGNHKKIADWRRDESERLTAERRPDLWAAHVASRPPEKPKRQRKKADPGSDQA